MTRCCLRALGEFDASGMPLRSVGLPELLLFFTSGKENPWYPWSCVCTSAAMPPWCRRSLPWFPFGFTPHVCIAYGHKKAASTMPRKRAQYSAIFRFGFSVASLKVVAPCSCLVCSADLGCNPLFSWLRLSCQHQQEAASWQWQSLAEAFGAFCIFLHLKKQRGRKHPKPNDSKQITIIGSCRLPSSPCHQLLRM